MKLLDIIITIACGEAAALVFADFLKEYDQYSIIRWSFLFIFPILGVVALWLADLIKPKFGFVSEIVKYVLVGVVSVFSDLKIFSLLVWILGSEVAIVSGFIKAISFSFATFVKFIGTKYWTFNDKSRSDVDREIIKFVLVTLVGLVINVGTFYYLSRILGTQFGISENLWLKISVVVSALVAAAWNFLSCKFIVFRTNQIEAPDEINNNL